MTPALNAIRDLIFARYPAALEFGKRCFCPVVAVISRKHLHPTLHFMVDDAEILAIAQSALRGSVYVNDQGPDAVLILGPAI